MRGLLNDARYALRALRKRPSFVAVVAVTFALGIGANSAVFAILHQVILRPLPYEASDRLTIVHSTREGGAGDPYGISMADFADLRETATTFESMAAVVRPQLGSRVTLEQDGVARRVDALRVTPSLFRVLGTSPVAGRAFAEPDGNPSAPPVVVLSHTGWSGRYASDPSIIGRDVRLDRRPHTVIGVLPPNFEFPLVAGEPEYWLPTRWSAAEAANREAHILDVVARLRPGVPLEAGRDEAGRIGTRLAEAHPATNAGEAFDVSPFRAHALGDVAPALRLLAIAGVLVLLVACVNVSVLLMARGDLRREEVALRLALGASGRRVGRLLMLEGLLLGMLGAIPGLLVGVWVARGLATLSPVRIPRLEGIGLSLPVVGFALVVCIVAGLLAGVAPAWKSLRGRVRLVGHPGRGTVGRRRAGLDMASLLIGVEAAIVLVSLSGAGLAFRSLSNLLDVEPGFDPAGAVALTVDLPPEEYADRVRLASFFEQARERLTDLPAIREAGTVSNLPLASRSWSGLMLIEGMEAGRPGEEPSVDWEVASPGYFEAMGIPVVRGRAFTDEDGPDAPSVTLVNRTLAERFWPDGGALGARISANGPEGPWHEIVGIVGDIKQQGLGEPTRPQMYVPLRQTFPWPSAELVVRLEPGASAAAVPHITDVLREIEAGVVVGDARPLDGLVEESASRARFQARLLGTLGILALLLGLAGVYGAVNQWVASMTREIGLRSALGARPRRLVAMVLARGLIPTTVGATVGLVAAVWAGTLMESTLYGVRAGDPVTLAAIVGLLLAGAVAATLIPARRALSLDPVDVLRDA